MSRIKLLFVHFAALRWPTKNHQISVIHVANRFNQISKDSSSKWQTWDLKSQFHMVKVSYLEWFIKSRFMSPVKLTLVSQSNNGILILLRPRQFKLAKYQVLKVLDSKPVPNAISVQQIASATLSVFAIIEWNILEDVTRPSANFTDLVITPIWWSTRNLLLQIGWLKEIFLTKKINCFRDLWKIEIRLTML